MKKLFSVYLLVLTTLLGLSSVVQAFNVRIDPSFFDETHLVELLNSHDSHEYFCLDIKMVAHYKSERGVSMDWPIVTDCLNFPGAVNVSMSGRQERLVLESVRINIAASCVDDNFYQIVDFTGFNSPERFSGEEPIITIAPVTHPAREHKLKDLLRVKIENAGEYSQELEDFPFGGISLITIAHSRVEAARSSGQKRS